MDLTFEGIGERLSEFKPIFHIKSNQIVSEYCLIHSNMRNFKPNYIYIARPSNIANNLDFKSYVNFILITNEPVPTYLIKNKLINLICIPDKFNSGIIINQLNNIFATEEKISIASTKLLAALNKGWSLQQILDLSSELLGNPILLLDVTTSVLGYAINSSTLDEPAWSSHITNGYVTPQYFNLYEKIAKTTINIQEQTDPFIIESSILNYRIFLHKVVFQSTLIAFLEVLEYNKNFSEYDSRLISLISYAISITLQQGNFVSCLPKSRIDTYISNLLSNKNIRSDLVIQLSKHFNINGNENLFILCIDLQKISDASSKVFYIKGIFERALKHNYGIIFDGFIVFLLIRKKFHIESDETLLISQLLLENDLVGGLSRCFQDLMNLHFQYNQAINSIKIGTSIHPEKQLYKYEYYMPYHLLQLSSNNIDLKELYVPELMNLIDYDKKKKTEFTLSLYHYIINNLNMQKTAEILHIHYNTLKYRLQKIESMLDWNIENANLQLSLRLSFLMIEYTNQIDFERYLTHQTGAISES